MLTNRNHRLRVYIAEVKAHIVDYHATIRTQNDTSKTSRVTKEQDFQDDFVKILSNSSQDMWKGFAHPIVPLVKPQNVFYAV